MLVFDDENFGPLGGRAGRRMQRPGVDAAYDRYAALYADYVSLRNYCTPFNRYHWIMESNGREVKRVPAIAQRIAKVQQELTSVNGVPQPRKALLTEELAELQRRERTAVANWTALEAVIEALRSDPYVATRFSRSTANGADFRDQMAVERCMYQLLPH